MTYEPAKQCIAFVMPPAFSKAEITLSRPTNPEEVIHVPVQPGNTSRYIVSTAKLDKGTWNVFLNWSNQNRWYHRETVIVVR